MSDLIDRSEFLKGFSYHAPEERFTPSEVAYLLGKAPTVDAVAVVRCRECANRNTCDCPLTYAVQWGIGNDEPSDDDFCSYGERKEPADGRSD